jgi:predicted transcriptional regulator YheO
LVETSIKNLAQSDWAMRHLGKGRNRPGLDRLYNQTTDSVRLVTVYAVLLELAGAPQEISNCIREEKLTLARQLLINNETPLLNLVMEQLEIIESPQEQRQHRRSPLTTHIEELAYDLAADDCVLSLPIFQLCSKTQTTAIVNLFNRAYKKSLKYIEPEYT